MRELDTLLNYFFITLLILFPCWKIFRRVGLNPAFSLVVVIPGLGWLIAAAIVAFSKWPAIEAPRPEGVSNV